MNREELLKKLTDHEYENSQRYHNFNVNGASWSKKPLHVFTPNFTMVFYQKISRDLLRQEIYRELNKFNDNELTKIWFKSI